jgi:magnesium transporter
VSRAPRRREKLRRRLARRVAPGAPPGTISIDPESPRPEMTLVAYGPGDHIQKSIKKPEELKQFLGQWPVCWLNVDGLGDAKILKELADIFSIHKLALEDIVNVHQRAKVDPFGDRHFIVTHMVQWNGHLEVEQLSLVLGPGFVVTFQERPGWDCLEPVRQRIRAQDSHVRRAGADYLCYELLDAVIDHNFPVLESIGERLDALEDQIGERPDTPLLHEIHDLKRELLNLRRIAWPQRDAINSLARDVTPIIRDETRLHFRDCYDHCVRIMDLIETYREMASDLAGLYHAALGNRTNEIIRVLTIISTIFIPLTFIVGIYGMNFHTEKSPWNMPELTWYWGYPAALALMAAITAVQLFFFWRKGWIGRGRRNRDQGSGVGGQA